MFKSCIICCEHFHLSSPQDVHLKGVITSYYLGYPRSIIVFQALLKKKSEKKK